MESQYVVLDKNAQAGDYLEKISVFLESNLQKARDPPSSLEQIGGTTARFGGDIIGDTIITIYPIPGRTTLGFSRYVAEEIDISESEISRARILISGKLNYINLQLH